MGVVGWKRRSHTSFFNTTPLRPLLTAALQDRINSQAGVSERFFYLGEGQTLRITSRPSLFLLCGVAEPLVATEIDAGDAAQTGRAARWDLEQCMTAEGHDSKKL